MSQNTIPHYDVIVIGSGSIGAPTALFLAQAGFRTLVLESGPSVGQGSNKKAIGGIRATHSDPAKIRLCLRSIEIFSTWQETYGDDIEWDKGGYLFVAYQEREEKILKDLLVKQKAYGLNIDWYNRQNALEIAPDLNPNGLLGVTFSPDDGSASPMLTNHAFYDHAHKLGVEFRFNEPVIEVIQKGGKISALKTPLGTYETDQVISCTGPWAAQIGQLFGINIPVTPDSHEAAITEPVAHFLRPMVVDMRPAPGSANYYFYQHKTGQIIFCITPSPSIWGFDTRETSEFLPMVAQRMIQIMPRLENIRVRRTWRGLYPMTPDGNPIIGRTREIENLILAEGMCGQGYMLGPGVGELLVRIAQKQTTEGDAEVLQILSPYRQFAGHEMLK
jgi:sarcosine oxidase subunit beta